MTYPARGTKNTKLVIIGDGPFGDDVLKRLPYSARGCDILPLELHNYGIAFNACYSLYILDKPVWLDANVTSVKKKGQERGWEWENGYYFRPWLRERQQEILREIDSISPDVILLTGELALWLISGQTNISTRRGSIYLSNPAPSGKRYKTVCTFSIADVQTVWDRKPFFDRDIQRAAHELRRGPEMPDPGWNFLIQASFEDYCNALDNLHASLVLDKSFFLSCDIETIRHEIACVGIAWSKQDAICVPVRTSREYWTIEQELVLISKLKTLLQHPQVQVVGQNFSYDAQYFATKWGVIPRLVDDTMDMQHVLFPGMPKGLHILASVYCDYYQYWKDELDDYKSAPKDDAKFFAYNCRDCCYTFEAREKLEKLLKTAGLWDNYRERIDQSFWSILRLNLRGVRIDTNLRSKLAVELMDASTQRQDFLNYVIGREFNPRSTVQMKEFFYNEMKVTPEKSRTTKKDSLGAEILQKLHEDYPLLGPVADSIIEMRSLGVFLKTFVLAQLDFDARLRTFFKLSGTETFRLSSSENAFGRGANLQNIPKGDRARTSMKMPNIRQMFIPDPGFTIYDIDLAGADAQVVAWTAGDEKLKAMFRAGLKIHAENAKDLFGGDAGPDGKREPYYTRTKMGVHLSNYGGYPSTMSKALGITVKEAERFQNRWFDMHPEIKDWHKRVESRLLSTRTVTNAFGMRRIYFGRLDRTLSEALAWEPQSVVALVTGKAMDIIDTQFHKAELLMQVHDSLVFQAPTSTPKEYIDELLSAVRIVVPFDDPLIIPWGVKSSSRNWGDC